jgi:hypothetical protein
MQIDGQPAAGKYATTVRLPRPTGDGPILILSPLPLGFSRRLREHAIMAPQPPLRVARDAQGRPLRQANGQPVVQADETDDEYLLERELYHQRIAVLSVVEALRNDPSVRFETVIGDTTPDWRPAADRIFAELEEAEWSAGDLVWLCTRICRLSNLLDAHLAEAGADFSSAAERDES